LFSSKFILDKFCVGFIIHFRKKIKTYKTEISNKENEKIKEIKRLISPLKGSFVDEINKILDYQK